MVNKNISIVKNRSEKVCALCNTLIENGESCLSISSPEMKLILNWNWDNVKIHQDCINSLIKEIKYAIKEDIIKNLK